MSSEKRVNSDSIECVLLGFMVDTHIFSVSFIGSEFKGVYIRLVMRLKTTANEMDG